MSHEEKSPSVLAGANANMRGHAFGLRLINPLRQNRTLILIRLCPIVLKYLVLCMKIKEIVA